MSIIVSTNSVSSVEIGILEPLTCLIL
ncbi:hypothetical protein AYI70_g10589, partial [Smittium culicis]